MQLKLVASSRAARTVDPVAHRLVLEGRHFWFLRSEADLGRAEAACAKALALAPDFAEAHAGLAGVLLVRHHNRLVDGFAPEAAELQRAREEAARAIALDAGYPDSYAIQGFASLLEGRFAESGAQYQQALRLNPNSAVGHHWHGLLLSARGQLAAASAAYARAAELDPLAFIVVQMRAYALQEEGRFAESLAEHERAAELRGESFIPNLALRTVCLQRLGRSGEAVTLARAMRQRPAERPRWGADFYAIDALRRAGHADEAAAYGAEVMASLPANSFLRGYLLAALGRIDEAWPFLEGIPIVSRRTLFFNPFWDEHRDNPRFQQLLVKLGWAEDYKVARETLARTVKERAARK